MLYLGLHIDRSASVDAAMNRYFERDKVELSNLLQETIG